ncbi:phosphopantetheine-binding protein [Marinobacterium mangrovicola]|uniref:Acyl carrier protein n=1 Tax=Marinobacterium mangrovicola TaxID=1476959 RepID=A0A4R1GWT5_9GAMM|nr:phosphopantetheine-binding protein [Marinobacterium mangrovicola]TCK08892.1 acyl carrier protein [Marinobacterium mangrovicola]
MKREELIEVIQDGLANSLRIPHIASFRPEARLNEDLHLDSVMILQLLLHLELECGYEIPDEALSAEAFATVNSLVDFLLQLQQEEGAHPEISAEVAVEGGLA